LKLLCEVPPGAVKLPVEKPGTHMNKSYLKTQSLVTLLPSIQLLEKSREIVDGALLELGKLALEAVLSMSAAEVAGPPQRGKKKGNIRHHGSQKGSVSVGGRRVRVERPRLRTKSGQEVEIPAYETLRRDPKAAERVLARAVKGVSSRDYKGVFDELGDELGVSRSSVSRQVKEASAEALKSLVERRIESRQIAIMIDGIHFGGSVILAAIGIDESGAKMLLGVQEGATESASAVQSLLNSITRRGVDSQLPTLFVLDGSRALAKGVREIFPLAQVQRCRVHKARNVLEHLPLSKRRYYQAKLTMAYTLPHLEATLKLKEIAKELELLHPGAASSLREGLEETLTLSGLITSSVLCQSLSSTNLIESSFSRARSRMRRITNFSSGSMALRWCASALLLAEENFRTIKGHKDLWMLKTSLDQQASAAAQ
jgi:putative transposase